MNALGVGAQGLGGVTRVLDVKIRSFPTHAASLPVALIPNCAATRHAHFTLDGSGPIRLDPPDLADWPEIVQEKTADAARRVDLDALDDATLAALEPSQTLLLPCTLFTGRDAAHKRMVDAIRKKPCRSICAAARSTMSAQGTRMDKFTDEVLGATGLKVTIGKAERGPEAMHAIRRHGAVHLVAVGGAAYLVSKAIKAARPVAWNDLDMGAIYELRVEDMPATVGVDAQGRSIHTLGPRRWRRAS